MIVGRKVCPERKNLFFSSFAAIKDNYILSENYLQLANKVTADNVLPLKRQIDLVDITGIFSSIEDFILVNYDLLADYSLIVHTPR